MGGCEGIAGRASFTEHVQNQEILVSKNPTECVSPASCRRMEHGTKRGRRAERAHNFLSTPFLCSTYNRQSVQDLKWRHPYPTAEPKTRDCALDSQHRFQLSLPAVPSCSKTATTLQHCVFIWIFPSEDSSNKRGASATAP